MRTERGTEQAYRFKEHLSRVAENEGETEDDCGKRDEGRQGVGTIEDEEAEEDDDDECDTG